MAKTEVKKKPASTQGDVTTYSTRLSAEQGKVMEEAASILGVSASKFIREASISRAVDVVNGSGRNALALRNVAAEIIDSLFNPRIRLIGKFEGQSVESEIGYEAFEEFLPDEPTRDIRRAAFYTYFDTGDGQLLGKENEDEFACAERTEITDVKILRPIDAILSQFRAALSRSGTEFIRIMTDELAARESGEISFAPKLDAAKLIARDSAEDD